jgi:deoxyribodipyrimidine photo-lyase
MRWDWATADDNALSAALRGCYIGEVHRGPLRGGRSEALAKLHGYDPNGYGSGRNWLDGPVSRLSPYLRHGLLDVVEVRAHLQNVHGKEPEKIEEFLRQLAWRDFFEKVLDYYGDALSGDLEEPKHNIPRSVNLPPDIATAATGLPCIDGMLHELFDDGYLHNHARLWFAAYLTHFRGVSWKTGAKLFRQYLYDGDIASNSSSWQWVESTFASKPYFMNKENIAKFSGNEWCSTCTVPCPFDANYETLEQKLFGQGRAPLRGVPLKLASADSPLSPERLERTEPVNANNTLVWVHDAAMSPTNSACLNNPNAAWAFVFDEPALRDEPWAFHRLAFVFDSVRELFQHQPNSEVLLGEPVDELLKLATVMNAKELHVHDHPNPWVRSTIEGLKSHINVVVHPRPQLAEYYDEPRRFSKYWEKCAEQVLGYKPKRGGKKLHQ